MMLRVRPAQLTTTVASAGRVGEGVGDPQRQLGAGHTAAAGDAESPVFLGRAGVEDDQLVAALDPLVQVVGADFRYVVYDFDALAEVLRGYVDAPLGGQVEAGPAIHAAGEPGDVAVAHRLGGGGGAYDAARVVVAEDQGGIGMRHRLSQLKLQAPARNQRRPGNMRGVVLPHLAHIDEGVGGVGGHPGLQLLGGDGGGHGRLRYSNADRGSPDWRMIATSVPWVTLRESGMMTVRLLPALIRRILRWLPR